MIPQAVSRYSVTIVFRALTGVPTETMMTSAELMAIIVGGEGEHATGERCR